MANTARQNILANIQSTLDGIATISYTELDRMIVTDLGTIAYPAAFIYSGPEARRDDRTIGKENWDWEVLIEVWAKNTSMETLLDAIHTAMHADYLRGNYAQNSYRVATDFFYVDPAQELRGMLIKYIITYEHELGDM